MPLISMKNHREVLTTPAQHCPVPLPFLAEFHSPLESCQIPRLQIIIETWATRDEQSAISTVEVDASPLNFIKVLSVSVLPKHVWDHLVLVFPNAFCFCSCICCSLSGSFQRDVSLMTAVYQQVLGWHQYRHCTAFWPSLLTVASSTEDLSVGLSI